jgi:predicted ATPase
MATAPENEAATDTDERAKPPSLRRVRIRGYKSIAFCDVALEPLTILVGRNASGKSNFLDALAFLRDAMASGVAEAVKRRGNWSSIMGHTTHIPRISFEMETGFTCSSPSRHRLPNGVSTLAPPEGSPLASLAGKFFIAKYSLELATEAHATPSIVKEALEIFDETREMTARFELQGGIAERERSTHLTSLPLPLPHSTELLELARLLREIGRADYPLLSVIRPQPFSDMADGLRSMGSYSFYPDAMRRPQKPNPGEYLERNGSHLASVIERTQEIEKEAIERVGRYLSTITESVEFLGVAKYGDYETVRFHVTRSHRDPPLEFEAASMSDGTLRTLAALVAAFQIVPPHGYPSLVAIEEPETSLHPAAMRALVDALDEATGRTQILLTTQSAELLDNPTIRPENVRVVQMIGGQTVIGPVDEASVEIVRRKLNTLGGLERDNQLEPDLDDLERQQRFGQSRQESPT